MFRQSAKYFRDSPKVYGKHVQYFYTWQFLCVFLDPKTTMQIYLAGFLHLKQAHIKIVGPVKLIHNSEMYSNLVK